MWKADCASIRRSAPTGQARRTAQPRVMQADPAAVSSQRWQVATSYPASVSAPAGQATAQGRAQASQGRRPAGGSASRPRSASAPRHEAISPRRSWTRSPTGDDQAPARFAQAMKGGQGGPPNGNSAVASSRPASAPITRVDQRSSGSAAPSAISGLAWKRSQNPGSSGPSRTSVPVPSGAPSAGSG